MTTSATEITEPTNSAVRVVRTARSVRAAREWLVTSALAAAVVAVFGAALYIGDIDVPPLDIVRVLTGAITADSDFATFYAIYELRLPRAVVGLLVGMAFGLSGVIFQTLVRNPLASPDIIGISSGASASVAVCVIVFGLSGVALSFGAMVGALAAAIAIYLLAWRHGVSAYRLVLVGIGIAAVLNATVSFLLTRADIVEAQRALVWITGSLNGSHLGQAVPLAAGVGVLGALALILARPLRSLQLGDDLAGALGTRVELSRLALIVVGVAGAAIATAAAGPIAFVAFVSGPIARRLLRGSGMGFIAAALVGALVTMLADLVAQNLLPDTQLPVGVVTGAIGAPYLIWLLISVNRAGKGAA